jgi:hypothetical protein
MNNVVLERPRCLNMFMASTLKAIRFGEKLCGTRCRFGNVIEFDFDYTDSVKLWAQPNVAYRTRKIEGYAVRVERQTYAKTEPASGR